MFFTALPGWLSFIVNWWRWIVGGIALAGVVWLVWEVRETLIDAERADQLEAAINELISDQETSHSIGMNLETGLNDYRAVSRKLDAEVQNATRNVSDGGVPRFDAGSVRRTTDRIAAGKAARERGN